MEVTPITVYPIGYMPENRQEAIEAQKEICEARNFPFFAPVSGICFRCRKDCVNAKWTQEPITKCSQCGYAFND